MKSSEMLAVGLTYSRNQLRQIFEISDASINTSIFIPKNYSSIWLFITKKMGKDRTQYRNNLYGDILSFDSQSKGRKDAQIINHLSNGNEILLFYRSKKDERTDYSFIYEGLFKYESHSGNNPVQFKLKRIDNYEEIIQRDLLSLKNEDSGIEGWKKERHLQYFERDQKLRSEAIRIHGTICSVCGFNFKETYGNIGSGFIEVHYREPLYIHKGPQEVNPRTDLVVVCSNCHRMIHRNINNIIEPSQLKQIISERKNQR